MIVKEFIQDGKLVKQYSDKGYTLLQVETGIEYNEAIDVYPSQYTYKETDKLIDSEQKEQEQQNSTQRQTLAALFELYRQNGKTIKDAGEYFQVADIPKPSFESVKKRLLSRVDNWTANKITGGFVSSASGSPVRYDSDKDTQLTMQGIALNVDTPLFAEKYPIGCPVRGYAEGATEKTVFWLGAEEVKRWCADLSIHIGECKQAGWQKQAEVNACTTAEELQAVKLD